MKYYSQMRSYIFRNARPLDIARWNYLFENGNKEDVLTALAAYQNDDGGFGNALEPDCWNPNSAPVQTWAATEILREIQFTDPSHPIIQGILKYLSSKKEFDGHTWANCISSNNEYPHAPWWTYQPNQENTYNPTACLIGFALQFADEESELFTLCVTLVKEAYSFFKSQFPMDTMHTVSCFVRLYEYLKECSYDNIVDMEEFHNLLSQQIKYVITEDTSRWSIDYVCKPSLFITSKTSEFYEDHKELCDFECDFINNTQNPDGTWNITWDWQDFIEEWSISKNWWKSDIIIKNCHFLKEMKHM